jgi:hypothetical protein
MTNLIFNLKSVQTGRYKVEVGAGSVAGAEPNNFCSAILVLITFYVRLQESYFFFF